MPCDVFCIDSAHDRLPSLARSEAIGILGPSALAAGCFIYAAVTAATPSFRSCVSDFRYVAERMMSPVPALNP